MVVVVVVVVVVVAVVVACVLCFFFSFDELYFSLAVIGCYWLLLRLYVMIHTSAPAVEDWCLAASFVRPVSTV